jgi:TetR/AcrR family transcriptional regulator, cholesterol catabolism regulator
VAPTKRKAGENLTAADRREQIRNLAAEMFFDQGYEATTMRQIAAALKIKPGSLYYHFPDKEQILFEVVDSVVRQLLEGAKELAARETEHHLKLAAVIVNHVVLHALRPKSTTLGDSELRSLTAKRRNANIRDRDAYEAFVVDVLRKGERAGDFKLLDAKLTAYALIAQSSNVGVWYHQPGRLSLKKVASVHVGLGLRGVASREVTDAQVSKLCDMAREFHLGWHETYDSS